MQKECKECGLIGDHYPSCQTGAEEYEDHMKALGDPRYTDECIEENS